jgi:hypothetical protein
LVAYTGAGVRAGVATPIADSANTVATPIARILFPKRLASMLVIYYPLLGIFKNIFPILVKNWFISDL